MTPRTDRVVECLLAISRFQCGERLPREIPEKPEPIAAKNLLKRAAKSMEDHSVIGDANWWREYFIFTGEHMILTDEGWESGANKQSYIDMAKDERYHVGDLILDEVNAPA